MLHGAMQATLGRGGVGVVGLPADVIGQPAVTNNASVFPAYTERLPIPSNNDVEEAAKLINDAQTVAVFAGCGATDAVSLVRELSEKLKAPVVTSYKSQMEMTRDMPKKGD